MRLTTRHFLIIVFAIVVSFIGWYIFHGSQSSTLLPNQTRKDETGQIVATGTKNQLPAPPLNQTPIDEAAGQVVAMESIVCGNSTYIFDLVLKNGDYINNIYKTSRSPENVLLRVSQQKTETGGRGVLRVLAVPKKNCDRIYFTRYTPDSDASVRGLFEWRLGSNEIRELATSQRFSGFYTPNPVWDAALKQVVVRDKDAVSPGGEMVVVAEPVGDKFVEGQFCDRRTLSIINLRDDTPTIVVQLPSTENLTISNTEDSEFSYCSGLNFGWQNDTTIYYDVYDATTTTNRSLEERRTLSIVSQ